MMNRLLLTPLALSLALSSAMPASAQNWVRTWAAAPLAAQRPGTDRALPDLTDRTVRQVVRISSGGDRLRIRLSNEESEDAIRVSAVRIALAEPDGRIVPGSSRTVTFAGQNGVVMAAHAPAISDPVVMAVKPGQRLTISIHLPDGGQRATVHGHAAAIAWIARGDQTDAVEMRDTTRFGQRIMITGVDVETRRPARTIVAFGDSITDGARATVDADTRYPDQLADRLRKGGMTSVAVANMGIGGNRLLADGTGISALGRFDRDVLAVPGVSHVIVLEGVNDIGTATRDKKPLPTPEALIGAYRQMIARARQHGVKVILATILPYKGAGYWSEEGEAVRARVNDWIRTQRESDGIADFDRAIRDPADPLRMAKAFDGGDALHPNDAGFAAMAGAVDLKLLR